MKKLKCESCGANLIIDDSKEYAKCEYCNANYKLKEDNDNNYYQIDYVISEGSKRISKMTTIGILVIIIPLLVFSFFSFYSFKSNIDKTKQRIENEIDNINEENVNDKLSFNGPFEIYNGINSSFQIKSLISSIILNNKKGNHLIKVIFMEDAYDDPDVITKELEDIDYNVSFDYDNNGYINMVTIS